MAIWRPAPVSEEPELVMVNWQVFRVKGDFDGLGETDHLMGSISNRGGGRVTSPIKHFDRESMKIVTRSGRVYHLQGPPGFSDDGEYVRQVWLNHAGLTDFVDITHEFE
jgi:ATP-dependent Lon protease